MIGQVRDRALVLSGVVVGYDGSPPASRALVWAAQECRLRGVRLHVVRAWTISTASRALGWSASYVPGLPELEAAVRDEIEVAVGEALLPYPEVDVSVHPVYGPAARSLIGASERADLLVVGRRGGGGFAGLLLGSVTEQCVRHARCPVVIISG